MVTLAIVLKNSNSIFHEHMHYEIIILCSSAERSGIIAEVSRPLAFILPVFFSGCGDDEWQCYDGSCIPWNWYCDGINDCSYNEDEDYCYHSTSTTHATHTHSTNGITPATRTNDSSGKIVRSLRNIVSMKSSNI